MRLVLPTLVALMLIVPPAAATAQERQTNAPPGNSAIDEYLETVPAPGGNRRPTPPAAGAGSTLTAAERARLERLGPDGKALADAIDATTSPSERATPAQRAAPAPAAEGRSPVREVLEAATGRDGGGGMGIALPAILLASLLGCIALLVMRRRSLS